MSSLSTRVKTKTIFNSLQILSEERLSFQGVGHSSEFEVCGGRGALTSNCVWGTHPQCIYWWGALYLHLMWAVTSICRGLEHSPVHLQTPRKLLGFYRTKEGFQPDFADFKHDYTHEFYRSYSFFISKCPRTGKFRGVCIYYLVPYTDPGSWGYCSI